MIQWFDSSPNFNYLNVILAYNMFSLNNFYLVGFLGALAALATPGVDNACGKLNVVFTLVSTSKKSLKE
jgi:hypothetical protein